MRWRGATARDRRGGDIDDVGLWVAGAASESARAEGWVRAGDGVSSSKCLKHAGGRSPSIEAAPPFQGPIPGRGQHCPGRKRHRAEE